MNKKEHLLTKRLAEIDEALKTAKRGTQTQSLLIRRAAIEKELKGRAK